MLYRPLIRKLEALNKLSNLERDAVIGLCSDVRKTPRRRNIIAEGDDPTRVHIILSGWAARFNILPNGSRRITAFLLPGDFCDMHGTVLIKMDHGIMAITDCEVAHVPSAQIDAITRSTPILMQALWRSTLIDEAILRRWLVNDARRDAMRAVAHLLCELHIRLRLVDLVENGWLDIPLIQEEIADATGLTVVHVNRMLKKLRELGLLEKKAGMLHLPNIAAMWRACDFDPTYLHLRGLKIDPGAMHRADGPASNLTAGRDRPAAPGGNG